MSRKYSDFDKRMKKLERLSDYYLNDALPIIARVDGIAFHALTSNLERPYSKQLHDFMIDTTCFLIKETQAELGFTQSDEISLLIRKPKPESEVFFCGRIQKMCSVIASAAASHFNLNLLSSSLHLEAAQFDCRVFNLTNEKEILNYLIWRQRDATRNSIQMAGQAKFSHKELHKKNTSQIQEMLFQKGINWNDYPEFFKRGSLCRKVQKKKYIKDGYVPYPCDPLEKDEIGQFVIRNEIVRVDTPIFNKENNPIIGLVSEVTK